MELKRHILAGGSGFKEHNEVDGNIDDLSILLNRSFVRHDI